MEAEGWLDADAWLSLEAEAAAEIRDAVAFAEAGTLEPVEHLERDVYARHPGGAS
jgi:pyruvate dehydrogenase E1 component alpha subunit